jgi:hypothetical protein
MSAMAEQARARAKSKAERLVRATSESVDASGWREATDEKGDVQTGPRPISRRQFRSGGKVAGEHAMHHAGRKPRKSGGSAFADALINRNVKEANEERDGSKHIGGMACGGRAHKTMGGLALPAWNSPVARKSGGGNWIAGAIKHPGALHKSLHVEQGKKIPEKKLNKAEHSKNPKLAKRAQLAETLKGMHKKSTGGVIDGGTRPKGDRIARKAGGRAKKGMNVNIIIAPGGGQRPAMPPPGLAPPPGAGPLGLRQGVAPPMSPGAAAPMGPGAAMPPMPRKRGGRAYPIDSGAGGGLGRLEKIRAYG